MKKPKIVVLTLGLAALFSLSINMMVKRRQADADKESLKAQTAGRSRPPFGMRPGGPGGMSGATKELGLSEDQQKEMEAVQTEIRASMTGKPPSGPPSQETMAKIETARKRMDAILTPAQREKMRELMASRMPGGMPGAPLGGPMGAVPGGGR